MKINENYLNKNDLFNYIIVSTNSHNFGIIKNVTLSICEIFGFSIQELKGQNLNIILPKIFHKEHNSILHKKMSEIKKEDTEEIKKKIDFKEINTFGVTKAKYLIELWIFWKIFYCFLYTCYS